jgi:hypothetical protein
MKHLNNWSKYNESISNQSILGLDIETFEYKINELLSKIDTEKLNKLHNIIPKWLLNKIKDFVSKNNLEDYLSQITSGVNKIKNLYEKYGDFNKISDFLFKKQDESLFGGITLIILGIAIMVFFVSLIFVALSDDTFGYTVIIIMVLVFLCGSVSLYSGVDLIIDEKSNKIEVIDNSNKIDVDDISDDVADVADFN